MLECILLITINYISDIYIYNYINMIIYIYICKPIVHDLRITSNYLPYTCTVVAYKNFKPLYKMINERSEIERLKFDLKPIWNRTSLVLSRE